MVWLHVLTSFIPPRSRASRSARPCEPRHQPEMSWFNPAGIATNRSTLSGAWTALTRKMDGKGSDMHEPIGEQS
jgi:hypothetical protein